MNDDGNDVTFLYKFIRGVANKSYGNNVAQAAGLPPSIIQRAKIMSEQFEQRCMEAIGKTSDNTHHTTEASKRRECVRTQAHSLFFLSSLPCRCVSSRSKLSAAYPQQKSSSSLALPRTTAQQLAAAVQAKNWPLVMQMRDAFKIAQQLHKKKVEANGDNGMVVA